jgi:hypothetical protein
MEIFSSLHLTGRRIALLVLGCVIAVVGAVAFVSSKPDVYEEDAIVFLGQFLGEDTAENTFAVEQQAADFEVALQLPEVVEQTATVAGITPDEVRAGLESDRDLVGTSVVVRFEHENPEVARDVVTTAPRIALQTLAEQQLSVAEAKEEAERNAVEEAEAALSQFRAETGTFDLEQEVVDRKQELREIQLSRAEAFGADSEVRAGLIAQLDELLASRTGEYQQLFARVPEYQGLVRELEDARVRFDEARDSRARAEARSAGASESAVIVDDVTSPVPRTSEYVRAALSAVIAVVALGLLGFALLEVLGARRRGVTRPAAPRATAGVVPESAPVSAAAFVPEPAPVEPVAAEPEPAPTVTAGPRASARTARASRPPAETGDELVETATTADPLVRKDAAENGGATRRPTQPRPRRRTPTSTPK